MSSKARKTSLLSAEGVEDAENKNQRGKKFLKSAKRLRREAAELEEENRLASLLFASSPSPSASTTANNKSRKRDKKKTEKQATESDAKSSELLFQIDRSGVDEGGNFHDGSEQEEPSAMRAPATENNSTPVFDGSSDGEDDEGDKDDGPAWVDEDDENVRVDLLSTNRMKKLRRTRTEEAASALSGAHFEHRLRQRYQDTMQHTARTDWAAIHETTQEVEDDDNDTANDSDDTAAIDLLQSSSAPLLATGSSSNKLPPGILNISRCPDANLADPSAATVQAVHFHPASNPDRPLLLTAGFDKTLRFFQVGAEKSEKIHGIHFPRLPIHSASFIGSTGNVIVSGRRPFFYIYNAEQGKLDHVPRILGRKEKSLEKCVASPDGRTVAFCGNDGYVILFDTHNKQWMADLKMNGSCRSMAFTPDGQQLLTSGSDGDVYRWDIGSRRCVQRFANQDGTITCSLAASSRHFAVGAESGVVNIYHDNHASSHGSTMAGTLAEPPSPFKSIMNLKTAADMIRFNHDGQILAMSTKRENNQGVKLLHVPTATVFSNWPTSKSPLNYVSATDFSPGSRFFALGNDKGKCLLYQLQHYCQED